MQNFTLSENPNKVHFNFATYLSFTIFLRKYGCLLKTFIRSYFYNYFHHNFGRNFFH